MSGRRVTERAKEAGVVGEYLKGLLPPEVVFRLSQLSFPDQISFVYSPQWFGRRPTDLCRAAAAYLATTLPVQVSVSSSDLQTVLDSCLGLPEEPPKPVRAAPWLTDPGKSVRCFPLKSNPAAQNKVNVYLYEVAQDLQQTLPLSFSAAAAALMPYRDSGMFNDQASAVLLYGTGLRGCHIARPYETAARLISDPELAKSLTNFIKAVGANATRAGAVLAEANAMLGRDVGHMDLMEEARYRTTSKVHGKTVRYEENAFRAEVRKVLEREIRREEGTHRINFPTLEEHWAKRWMWAVNGAHSGLVSALYPREPKPEGMVREHRRAWLESVSDDPRTGWDGTTYVSASPKLETGKTRAIFACDTVHYLAFEHLLGEVERRWRHERAILDPGRGGHVGMVFKVAAQKARAGVSMMLDYDDFNSQHTTESQVWLFEELMDLVGYPSELRAPLLASFSRQRIYVQGKCVGTAKGTLMSGHRGTTFINTVLNLVYLRLELGGEFMDRAVSLHVGDDVYLGVRTYSEVGYVERRLSSSKLRLNPLKQSVGHLSTEFLRNATRGRDTYGYFARSVSTAIAGNWVSDAKLQPRDALITMITTARSLANRSGSDHLPLLLFRSCCRMTQLPKEDHLRLIDLLRGTLALDNGPQFFRSAVYRRTVARVELAATDDHGYAPLPSTATTQYLATAATPLEVDVLQQAGVSVSDTMVEASFRKSLPERFTQFETLRLLPEERTLAVGSASVNDLLNAPIARGWLEQFPLLTLARHRLPEWLVRYAVGQAGGNPGAIDLDYEAWGEFKHGCIIANPMSYPDAAAFGKRTVCSVLTCPQNVFV